MERGLRDAFRRFHHLACDVMAVDPGFGAQKLVAHRVRTSESQYSMALSGRRGSLDLLHDWCRTMKITITLHPDGRVELHPREVERWT